MLIIRALTPIRLMALIAVLLSIIAPANAAAGAGATAPSIVGFWVGEKPASNEGDQPGGDEATYYNPADRSALTPQVWRALQINRVSLYLHLRHGRDFGPRPGGVTSDAVALVRKANALGIPVVAWVVIPYDQGYWAYQGNAQANFTAVRDWTAWTRRNRLRFVSVALDQEFSWQNLQTYMPLAKSRDAQKLDAWMAGNIDPAAQCSALRTYRDLISWVHRRGIRADAAVAPMVADDLADGDIALQNALQISATSRYDRLYLMAYRSAVSQAGFDPGPGYVASNYAAMRRYYGDAGQVSLGIPGQAPYADITPLADDVRMLAALGARSIPIFSLEEMVHAFGAEGVNTLAEAARRPMSQRELAQYAKPTPVFERMQAMSRSSNSRATELALQHNQSPNKWANGCGNLPVAPLARR